LSRGSRLSRGSLFSLKERKSRGLVSGPWEPLLRKSVGLSSVLDDPMPRLSSNVGEDSESPPSTPGVGATNAPKRSCSGSGMIGSGPVSISGNSSRLEASKRGLPRGLGGWGTTFSDGALWVWESASGLFLRGLPRPLDSVTLKI
jgi:hypothetical protein